jgi:hypothetical protein
VSQLLVNSAEIVRYARCQTLGAEHFKKELYAKWPRRSGGWWPTRPVAESYLRQLADTDHALARQVGQIDGHPPYASPVAELRQTSELGRRCRCRTRP